MRFARRHPHAAAGCDKVRDCPRLPALLMRQRPHASHTCATLGPGFNSTPQNSPHNIRLPPATSPPICLGVVVSFESTKMRCQAAFLFVLLAATRCAAADHLLRQQHEQELLKAKVGPYCSSACPQQPARGALWSQPAVCGHQSHAGQPETGVRAVDVAAQQGLLQRRKGGVDLRVGPACRGGIRHLQPILHAVCRRRSSASTHGPTTCATLRSTMPSTAPTG